jgi:tetratricopeptide (TPR) repeat protein
VDEAEFSMRRRQLKAVIGVAALASALGLPVTAGEPSSLEQARTAVEHSEAAQRLAAIDSLAEEGTMDDVERLVARLRDSDERVRAAASAALWRVWSRSGDPAVDALLARGTGQMQSWDFEQALATFSDVISRRPDFAEGWNKRATVLFLMGEYEASLKDCDEVLKRNPQHFGALAGAGQNHVELGHVELAIDYFKRALAVNPNLPGPAASIRILEQHLRARERDKA